MKPLLLLATVALFAAPAAAHAQAAMPGMDMAPASPPKEPAPATGQAVDHSAHTAAAEPAPPPGQADPHAGHDPAAQPDSSPAMADMAPGETQIGTAPAPEPPTDHAADALFDPAGMALSRRNLRRENGAFSGSMILFDLAEYQARPGGDGYRWESDAWFGGDINRLQIKTEGEGAFGEPIEDLEIQALYSRAVTPFWNAHIGLHHDIAPNPSRTYAVVGVEGLAPYWIHASGQLFLSDKGDVRVRLEGSYDVLITQRLVFQPRAEVNFSAQDMPDIGVGSGLSSFEFGARMRYEVRKEFAPYIGVEWSGRTGDTARYARLAGDTPNTVNVVAGIRFWF